MTSTTTTRRPCAPGIGANVRAEGTVFQVWAPEVDRVDLVIEGIVGGVSDRQIADQEMMRDASGHHTVVVSGAPPGTLYRYRLDGRGPFPDPASRWQPQGVHGPSAVVDPATFQWTDAAWTGVPLERTVFYELHIGTFTPEGTFAAAAARLPTLADLGVTAVLVMPVADFPGTRNWGYDGVAPFAPARCYGSPDDFRRFVDAAHASGLAVHLDVVYNHLGPDGAYQATFSRFYYSTTHRNPWGAAINFDGPHSAPVRAYFIENARRWVHEFHIDGLRLDATHAISDHGPAHVLAELADAVRVSVEGSPRPVLVIAEDSRNLNTIVRGRDTGGWAFDGVWADDFHHHLRRSLAGDTDGYFADFDGTAASIASTARQGWFFTGQLSPRRGQPRGTDPAGVPPERCVICLQNHDQVGNRAFGERLHHQISAAAWRAASTLLLILPETPLLFMGQEWAASSPFLYFTDHEPALGRLVTEGRRHEFAAFNAFSDPVTRAHIPDPQASATFERSRLDWTERQHEPHASTLRLYRRLLELRRSPAMARGEAAIFEVEADGPHAVIVHRGQPDGTRLLTVVRLHGAGPVAIAPLFARLPDGLTWRPLITTEDAEFAVDAAPPTIAGGAGDVSIHFHRPGAVILAAGPPGTGGLS
jgi:maltooligosyltrehalose trehalohydrolase